MDLTQIYPEDGEPWDFTKPRVRDKAIQRVKREKPFVLVGCPPRTAMSILFNSNKSRMDPEKRKKAIREAIVHLRFCVELFTKFK